jgi:hypothetical protein
MSLAFLSRPEPLRQLGKLDLLLLEPGIRDSSAAKSRLAATIACTRPVLLRVHVCARFVQASRY